MGIQQSQKSHQSNHSEEAGDSHAIDIYEADLDQESDSGESYDDFDENDSNFPEGNTFGTKGRHGKPRHRHRHHGHRHHRHRAGDEESSKLSFDSSESGSTKSNLSSHYSTTQSEYSSARYADITCSDTDCSWISEDSDYSSIFSLYEEDMEPTKWMVKFDKWLRGGDIYEGVHDKDKKQIETESEYVEVDKIGDGSEVMSMASSKVEECNEISNIPLNEQPNTIEEQADSKRHKEQCQGKLHRVEKSSAEANQETCTPSKYAVVKTSTEPGSVLVENDLPNISTQVSGVNDSTKNMDASSVELPVEGSRTKKNNSIPAEIKPDTNKSQFSVPRRRYLHRQLLPIRSESEFSMDDAETENYETPNPAKIMQHTDALPQPGSVPWRELTRAAKAAWRSWGWNHENWNQIIKDREIEVERKHALKAWRRDGRKYRREIRKERRENRAERRRLREERKRKNRRGRHSSQSMPSKNDPMYESLLDRKRESAEVLIKRIMARAEQEQKERDRKAAADNAVRQKAKLAAIGIDPNNLGPENEDENSNKVEELDFDLEMRERPWNSRSHADRSEILYRTLYRPFTKNV